MIRRVALAFAAAWLVFAAVIIGRFADEALPLDYLARPLLVSGAVALMIALPAAWLAGRHAVAVAAGLALLVAIPLPVIALSFAAVILGALLWRRRSGRPIESQRPVLILAAVFLIMGGIRAVSVIDVSSTNTYREDAGGPPMYVILLDGYPRMDTLARLGIDNRPFVNALIERGFDHYADSHSIHSRTQKTLLAMLTEEPVNDDPVPVAELRVGRSRLVVPPGFVAINSPVGYVTLRHGPRIDPGGPNDFEIELIGQSAVGVLVPDWAWALFVDGLRDRVDRTLALTAERSEPRIFAHVMAPHPPFLYGAEGSARTPRWCWPDCGLFTNFIEDLRVSREQWASGMAPQIEGLNRRLLETVDDLIARHPDAVIVLFSDHGGRTARADLDEWHRSFLAARTPGHPELFADAPRPDAVIRTLLDAYGEGNPGN